MPNPTGANLAAFLVDRGILTAIPEDVEELDDIMAGVVQGWERDTGWPIFLAGDTNTTRKYSLNGGNVLYLDCGLLEVLTLEIDGTEYTEGTNFWLRPANAPNDSWPYTSIEFDRLIVSNPNGIEIDGTWAFCDALPVAVLNALLRKGAAEFLRDIDNTVVGKHGSVVELRQDDVQKKFGGYVGLMGEYDGSLQQQFGRAYDRAVPRYMAPWLVMT